MRLWSCCAQAVSIPDFQCQSVDQGRDASGELDPSFLSDMGLTPEDGWRMSSCKDKVKIGNSGQ